MHHDTHPFWADLTPSDEDLDLEYAIVHAGQAELLAEDSPWPDVRLVLVGIPEIIGLVHPRSAEAALYLDVAELDLRAHLAAARQCVEHALARWDYCGSLLLARGALIHALCLVDGLAR